MVKRVFAFPGVGVELSGYEFDFYLKYKSHMVPLLKEASSFAGVDLIKAIESNSISSLTDSQNQFFTYAFSTGVGSLLIKRGIVPDITAGYSLGVYSSVYLTGAISFKEGLNMIQKAYSLMEAVCEEEFGMCAIVGLTQMDIETILKSNNFNSLKMVNSNNDTCKIIAGRKREINELLIKAKERDAINSVLLPVSIPYHHPLFLKEASNKFKAYLEKLNWKTPGISFISSIDQSILFDIDSLKKFIASHLSTPISWQKVIESLEKSGAEVLIECGPGISITQNGRFLNGKMKYINIKNYQKRLGL